MSKQKTKPSPRSIINNDYRYTVDELLSLMIVCGDDQVLLYDTCNMHEYNYAMTTMHDRDVKKHTEEEKALTDIFEAFIISTDECLKHSDVYWKKLAPGADLLEAHLLEPDEGHHKDAVDYAQTKLNIQSNLPVLIDRVPLVHALPLPAVRDWLKFVGRKFSDIPRDDDNKHIPFCTRVM